MRELGLILLLTATVACKGIVPEGASRGIASVDSLPAKWKGGIQAFPIQVELADTFETAEIDAIDKAAISWSSAVDGAVNFFDTSLIKPNKEYQNVNKYQDSVMGVYKLTTWPEGLSETALAVTQLFGYRKNVGSSNEYVEIHHADILINYENWDFKPANHFGYDLETVVLHEMGHFIGLYHDSLSPTKSVMYPSIGRYDENRTPLERDIQNIKDKYSIGVITPQGAKQKLNFIEENSSQAEEVSLILELNANGKCKHYLNGELVHEH